MCRRSLNAIGRELSADLLALQRRFKRYGSTGAVAPTPTPELLDGCRKLQFARDRLHLVWPDLRAHQANLEALRAICPQGEFATAWAHGANMVVDEALSLALDLRFDQAL